MRTVIAGVSIGWGAWVAGVPMQVWWWALEDMDGRAAVAWAVTDALALLTLVIATSFVVAEMDR